MLRISRRTAAQYVNTGPTYFSRFDLLHFVCLKQIDRKFRFSVKPQAIYLCYGYCRALGKDNTDKWLEDDFRSASLRSAASRVCVRVRCSASCRGGTDCTDTEMSKLRCVPAMRCTMKSVRGLASEARDCSERQGTASTSCEFYAMSVDNLQRNRIEWTLCEKVVNNILLYR